MKPTLPWRQFKHFSRPTSNSIILWEGMRWKDSYVLVGRIALEGFSPKLQQLFVEWFIFGGWYDREISFSVLVFVPMLIVHTEDIFHR